YTESTKSKGSQYSINKDQIRRILNVKMAQQKRQQNFNIQEVKTNNENDEYNYTGRI
ncbi:9392_t:CDS:1, partial [Scutellospora calospora]